MQDWQTLENQWERLRWARMHRTDFERMKDAAESLGIKPGTYRTYEFAPATEGGRLPPIKELQRICRKYGVNWVWVATGRGDPDKEAESDERLSLVDAGLKKIEPTKQQDALNAVLAVLDSFSRKAG